MVDNGIIITLAIEDFEPGQDWKVAALRTIFYVLAFYKGRDYEQARDVYERSVESSTNRL